MSLNLRLTNARKTLRAQDLSVIGDDMIHVPIFANAVGDNVVIPPPGRRFLIMELLIWNAVGAQTLIYKDGTANPLLTQVNVPISGGLFMGFAGNNQPHFTINAGNGFVINLSAGTEVDGFAKYKLA